MSTVSQTPNHGYYFAYSRDVVRFLKERGIPYICTGLHPKTRRQFYLFKQTAELSEALTEYSKQKG